MSIGFGILKSVIENDSPFSELIEHGIDEHFFEGQEKQAYIFIKNFRYKHKTYPKLSTVEIEIDKYNLFDSLPSEPLEYWASHLRNRRKFNLLNRLQGEIAKNLKNNNENAAIEKLHYYTDLINKTDIGYTLVDLQQEQLEVINKHNETQLNPGITGIPFGFPSLDELTYGNQKGDFNLVVGETGVGKSYITLRSALTACEQGANVIFISPEMPTLQVARRLLAMQAGLKDRALRKGQLSYFAVQKALRTICEPISLLENKDNYFKLLPSGMYSDINNLISICSEYKPDILYIDGIYLLKNISRRFNNSWKEDESIYFLLKDFAIHGDLPILATTQYNRSKPGKMEGTRGTQSAYQTASNYFSFEYVNIDDKDTMKPIQHRHLKTKKSRDGDSISIVIELNFKTTTIKEKGVVSQNGESEPAFEDPDFINEI